MLILIHEVDDKHQYSVLDVRRLNLLELFHVQKGVYYVVRFNYLFFSIFQIGFKPFIFHRLRHGNSLAWVSFYHPFD